MKRYEKYKPSGVEWIGEIPEHWDAKKLKYLVNVIDEPLESTDFLIAVENIESGTGKLIGMKEDKNYQGNVSRFNEGDTIFNKLRPYLAKVYFAEKDGGCFGELLILRSKGELLNKFLFYRVISSDFIGIVNSSTYGTKMPRANWDDFISHLFIPYTNNQEQTAIANYLDEKTAQIDTLVANKQKLIELLKEERTAIINQAVTKGINPKAKLKPSGVDWLGDIPEHWEVKKLKYVAEINSTSLTEKEDDDLEIEYIDISSVNENGDIIQTAFYIYSDAPSRARRIIRKGDTIISTVRTYLKAIAFIDFKKDNLICSTGFAVIRPLEAIEPKFLFYLSRSEKMVDRIMAMSKGVSYPAIDSDDIRNLEGWFPHLEEQRAIVKHIETGTSRIDATISKIEKEIELMQEYRTALISEAVTGKIKVS